VQNKKPHQPPLYFIMKSAEFCKNFDKKHNFAKPAPRQFQFEQYISGGYNM